MENLKIGEDPLDLNLLIKVIKKSPSYHRLLQDWRQFGRNLGVSESKLVDVSRQLGIGTTELHDIPLDLLSLWRAGSGDGATLQALYNAFTESNLRDVAALLEKTFWLTAVKSLEIRRHENDAIKMGDFLSASCSEQTYKRIYDALKTNEYTQPIPLLKPGVAPKLATTYYIQRKLSYMTQVDEKIFRADLENQVVVVNGMSKHELAILSGFKPVDLSGNQLDEVNVAHILLERDTDFQKICKKTTDAVHLIRRQNNSFFWVNSSGGLETIQRFKKGEHNISGEDELMMSASSNCAQVVSISDSPGMGKSFLLANLAFKFQSNTNSIAICIILNEFSKETQFINSPSAALGAIAEYACTTEVSKIILKTMMNNSQTDLFLDGYDEVEQLNIVDSFLNQVKELKNFRIFVTTRPHFRRQLESILNVISYEILPFNESNQNEFLTKYWANLGAQPGERLEKFARECLKTLYNQMTDMEKGIAGIPLQCRILADVFAEEAERVSIVDTELEKRIKIASLFDMYKKLVELKFRRLTEYSRNRQGVVRSHYINAHIFHSIVLLFPDWIEKFQPHLDGFDQVDKNTLYSIGLIEKSAYVNNQRFVHRTFAQYILAEFLVLNLTKLRECAKMIYGVIFGGRGFKEVKPWSPKPRTNEDVMKYPVMAYFINMHLKDKIKHSPLDKLALHIANQRKSIGLLEDVCKAIKTCACQEFEACFDLSMKVLQNYDLHQRGSDFLTFIIDHYFKLMPHLVVQTYDKLTVIKKVLEFTSSVFQVDLSYHVFQPQHAITYPFPWIPGCTPLHVAVYYGKYNIVAYLVLQYQDRIKDLKNLLHVCVHDSSNNTEYVIQEKLTIITLLREKEKEYGLNWFGEFLGGQKAESVHVTLLQHVANVSGDIKTGKDHTVAPIPSCSRNNGMDYLQASSNKIDNPGSNPVGEAEDSTPKTRANFDMHDNPRDSVHHEKLNNEATMSKTNTGERFGKVEGGQCLLTKTTNKYRTTEDVNLIKDKNQTAAHLILEIAITSGMNTEEIIERLNLLISKGFTNFNHPDHYGLTPLHYAMRLRNLDSKLLDFFYKVRADFSTVNVKGWSLVTTAIWHNQNGVVLNKLLEYGADLYNIDSEKRNALHFAADRRNKFALEFLVNHLDIESMDEYGTTPLFFLFLINKPLDPKLLDLFHENGANFNASDKYGQTVLAHAIQSNQNSTIINKMLEYGAVWNNVLSIRQSNALHFAAWHRNVSALECLIKKIGINSTDKDGRTALIYLVVKEDPLDPQLLNLFKDNGADFNAKDKDGWSALFHAIESNQNDVIVSKLLEYGADPYALDLFNYNALMIASAYANSSALELLLDALNFNINAVDEYGNTCLHELFSEADKDYRSDLKLLLKKGAKFDIVNKHGYFPLVAWIHKGNNPIPSLLDIKHLLPITEKIACFALTSLICQEPLMKAHLTNSTDHEKRKKEFEKFFSLLIKKGGRLVMRYGSPLNAKSVPHERFDSLNQILFTNEQLKLHLGKKFKIMKTTRINNLIKNNNVPIEDVLEGLLTTGQYEVFQSTCIELKRIIFSSP